VALTRGNADGKCFGNIELGWSEALGQLGQDEPASGMALEPLDQRWLRERGGLCSVGGGIRCARSNARMSSESECQRRMPGERMAGSHHLKQVALARGNLSDY